MTPTEWESFTTIIQSDTYSVVDCGPLHGPIRRFVMRRDADLKIILETTSDGSSSSTMQLPLAGTVRASTDSLIFSGLGGGTATARGVIPFNLNTSYGSMSPFEVKTETSRVTTVTWRAAKAVEPAYTIDWLTNVPNDYLWPDAMRSEETETKLTEFTATDFQITMRTSVSGRSFGRTCVHLCIEGMDVFFGTLPKESVSDIKSPGYILYKGNPDSAFREKLLNALSFALGQYLIYFGHTGFTEEWELNCLEAVSPLTLGGAASRLVTMPPAPLDFKYQWGMDPIVLKRIVGSIFLQYEPYHLRSILWGYWHGIAAPVHIAAVHFAAIVEALQESFFEIKGSASKTLLDKASWKKLKVQLLDELEKIDATSEAKTTLRNKLNELNTAPQSILMKRFLDNIGIEIGAIEERAWRNGRNRAAHGGRIEADGFITVIRENKALQILTNRLILAICNGADCYHDYYTLGHPTSRLELPIPDDLAASP